MPTPSVSYHFYKQNYLDALLTLDAMVDADTNWFKNIYKNEWLDVIKS